MDCSFDTTPGAVIVAARGKVDEATWEASHAIWTMGNRTGGPGGSGTIAIPILAGLDYMSSRGLRVLTVAKREGDDAGVAVTLASPNDVMREILAISRYDKLFTITDTVEAAH